MIDFPFRDQCQVELLIEGKQFFPSLIENIEAAQRTLYVEMYLVTSGFITTTIINKLCQAAQRGVKVLLIFDDVGCRGLSTVDRRCLRHEANIELKFYNPLQIKKGWANIFRDHRKIIIMDDEVAYIGGAGIADEFFEGAKHGTEQPVDSPWLDIMAKVKGPLVSDMVRLFRLTWKSVSSTPIQLPNDSITTPESCWQGAPRYRLLASRGIRRSRIKKSMIEHINGAVNRVWIVNPYFYPSRSIRRALRRAARKGVDVRLIFPSEKTDHPLLRYAGQRFYATLLRAGIKIYEYQTSFIHAKALLCDSWASVGSYNLDMWSIRWNLEANIETNDVEFISKLQVMMATCHREAELFDAESWARRSKLSIVREFLAWWAGRLFLMMDAPRETKNYFEKEERP